MSMGCAVAGFIIGTAAHSWAEQGILDYRWNPSSSQARRVASPGGAMGLLVGLPTFYVILHGRATRREWAILISVPPATATIVCLLASGLTMVLTPRVTVAVAVALSSK